VQQLAEADRRVVEVQAAIWVPDGQLDWWVKDRQEWWGRVRGANGRQRWIKATDLRPPATHCRDLSLAHPKVRTPGAVAAAPAATLVFG
jgi:hypothetical protein